MRPLSAAELLEVWERGIAQTPVQRALTLLAAACPDTSVDALAGLSVGRRDGNLLTLREWTFGPHLVGLATCPGCGQHLELAFTVADIRADPAPETAGEDVLSVAGYELRFRLPTSLDLATVTEHADPEQSRQVLLSQCLLYASYDGEGVPPDRLPSDVVERLAERMALADPQADVQLAISCPSCGCQWREVFDIVSFLWNETNAWAYRMLREVHVLASAYGWREADILAISPWRLQVYLDMVSR